MDRSVVTVKSVIIKLMTQMIRYIKKLLKNQLNKWFNDLRIVM